MPGTRFPALAEPGDIDLSDPIWEPIQGELLIAVGTEGFAIISLRYSNYAKYSS